MDFVRFRYWVGKNWKLFLIILVIIFASSTAIAVNTYKNPPVEITEVTENEQEVSITTSTSAVVNTENELYEQGETLDNRPVYFSHLTDGVSYHTHITVPNNSQTEVVVRSKLQLVGETTNGEEFWSQTRQLGTSRKTTSGRERVHTDKINVTEIQLELGEKQSEVNGRGVFYATIITLIEYDTGQYSNRERLTSQISSNGGQVRVQRPSTTQTHSDTRIDRTRKSPINNRLLLFSMVSGGSILVGIWTIVYGRDIDTDQLKYKVQHIQYNDWISEGEIPTSPNREPVKINNISGLVDIAIDSNKRVIYNNTYEIYVLIEENILYYFSREPELARQWFEFKHPEIGEGHPHTSDVKRDDVQQTGENEGSEDETHLSLFDKESTGENMEDNQEEDQNKE